MALSMGYHRLLAVGALAALCACAPGIRVQRLKPSRYNLGSTQKVAVLEVQGPPIAVSQVTSSLQKEIVNGNYYQLINAANRGYTIVVASAGGRVDVSNVSQQVPADVYVVAQVTRYEVFEEASTEKRTENGRTHEVVKVTPKGYAEVNFQVVKSDGRVLVMREYGGDYFGSSFVRGTGRPYNPNDLLQRAVREAVEEFVSDVTPRQVVEKIELDDDDEALKPGIRAAEAGDLAGAERAWTEVIRREPNNSGAIFNLGVLLETRGEFDAAADAYRKALNISHKSLYSEALEDLNERLRDAESLQRQI